MTSAFRFFLRRNIITWSIRESGNVGAVLYQASGIKWRTLLGATARHPTNISNISGFYYIMEGLNLLKLNEAGENADSNIYDSQTGIPVSNP